MRQRHSLGLFHRQEDLGDIHHWVKNSRWKPLRNIGTQKMPLGSGGHWETLPGDEGVQGTSLKRPRDSDSPLGDRGGSFKIHKDSLT